MESLAAADNTNMERTLSPHEAFNLFVNDSILHLDVCATPAPLLPGAERLDPALPLLEAAEAARQTVMDELTPDNSSIALLMCDDPDVADGRGCRTAHWLLSEGHCSRVFLSDRALFSDEFGFTMGVDGVHALPIYPNVVLPGKLYLGAACCANADALDHLGITHVVSVIDRKVSAPAGRTHLLCRIEDDSAADLAPVMHAALPFIEQAIGSGGRVLVHCARGASRSASVACAYLMRVEDYSLDAALKLLKEARPCVAPNDGFLLQLMRRQWEVEDAAAATEATCKRPLPADQHDRCLPCGPHARPARATRGIGTPEPSGQGASPTLQDAVAGQYSYTYRGQPYIATAEDPRVSASDPEIQIESEWASLLEPNPPLVVLRPAADAEAQRYCGDDRLLSLEHLLSDAEATRLLEAADAVGFGRTSYPKDYRGNLRLITNDRSLAEAVWERLRPFVPQTVETDGALWRVVGLNECWRLAKYLPGDRFRAHCDACFERATGERSMFTVNIYMNDVPREHGGATRFYADGAASRYAEVSPVVAVAPESGLAVVFRQPPHEALLHDGEELRAGVKFLFRSDVMYERQEGGRVGSGLD